MIYTGLDIENWPIIQPRNYSLESFKLCLEGNFQNSSREHLHKEPLLLSPSDHFKPKITAKVNRLVCNGIFTVFKE